MLPFLDSLLGAFSGDSVGSSLFGFVTEPFQTLMDSLGLSRHGRDQYFQRELSWDMLESQQNFQREMFNKSADFNADQAQLGRDFTLQMYQKQLQDYLKNYPALLKMQSDSQFNIWKNQFQMQNDYNSPGAQTQRLLAAGINPSSVFGGSGSVATSQMGASNLQQPPLISPTPFGSASTPVAGSPVGLPSGYVGNMRQNISDVGSFLRDIAEAKKKGIETEQLEKLFDYEIEERSQRIFGMRLTNDSISLANYVNNKIKDVKVRKATEDLLNVVASTKNLEGDTALKTEQLFTERSQQLLNVAKANLSNEDYELLKLRVDSYQEEFQTTMQNLRADTNKKVAETRFTNALRETENQLREGRVECQTLGNEQQRIGNELLYNDLWLSNRTLDAKIMALMHTYEREGIITKQEAERLYQLSVSSDWAQRREFINYVGATASAVGSVLSGAGSAVSGAASWKNAKWNNLNYQQKNQIMRDIGSERNRILDDYQKGIKDAKRSSILGPDWEMYSDQWSR